MTHADEIPRFRIAILAELAPRPAFAAASGKVPRRPTRLDKTSLGPFFAEIGASVSIEVGDPLGAAGVKLRLEIAFREPKGLRPDMLGESQPELRALTEAHRLLRELREGTASLTQVTERLPRILARASWSDAVVAALSSAGAGGNAAPAAETLAAGAAKAPSTGATGAPPESILSRLLEQVDVAPPAAAPSPGVSRASSIIAAVARGSSAPKARTDARAALDLVEGAYRTLLASILAHAEMRRLASAWQGLRWVVERCDFRSGVELEVACVPRDEVLATLRAMAERDEDSSEPAVDLFVVDHAIGVDDVERLAGWADVAASVRAPVVVSVEPALLSVERLDDLEEAVRRAEEPGALLHEKLRAFAKTDDARWVVAAVNGALARGPHLAARGAEITYEERPDARGLDVVASPYLIASLCAASHKRSGWATDIQGAQAGVVEDLPLSFVASEGEDLAIPLEAFVRETAARALGRNGIAVASCLANRDQALFFRVPALHREGGDKGESSTATLADQLFTRRLAEAVELLASAVPASADVRAVEQTATLVLAELFGSDHPKPEIRVGVVDDPATGGKQLRLSCSPRGFHGVSVSRLDLAARLGS